MRASFLSLVLARALYYVAKDMQVVIGFTSYTLELWNSSFNAETNARYRSQKMTVFRANNVVIDFTPETAKLVFTSDAIPELEELIRHPTPALPSSAAQPPSSEAPFEEEPMDL